MPKSAFQDKVLTASLPGSLSFCLQNIVQALTDLEDQLIVTRGEGWWWGGIVREFGMDMYTLLYLKWITNKDLLYSAGNSAQCCVSAWIGG